MKNETVSSPTDPGCTGVSRPVVRKGIVCSTDLLRVRERPSAMSMCLIGLPEGFGVKILEEEHGFYKVRLWQLGLVGYVPSHFIQEVKDDA